MKPTTSKRKYTWNQLPARENIHETNYQQEKIYMKPNQVPARENIHETKPARENIHETNQQDKYIHETNY